MRDFLWFLGLVGRGIIRYPFHIPKEASSNLTGGFAILMFVAVGIAIGGGARELMSTTNVVAVGTIAAFGLFVAAVVSALVYDIPEKRRRRRNIAPTAPHNIPAKRRSGRRNRKPETARR